MDAKSVVIGYALGYNDGLDSSGGGEPSDDWQPPEIPEPEAYEMFFLVDVVGNGSDDTDTSVYFEIQIAYTYISGGYWSTVIGLGSLTVDWGDGTVLSDEGYDPAAWERGEWVGNGWFAPYYGPIYQHTYTSPGRYLIKCTCTEYSNFLNYFNFPYKTTTGNIFTAAIKLGSEIIVTPPDTEGVENGLSQRSFMEQPRLEYIKFSGKNGLPLRGFERDYNLRRVDIGEPPAVLTYEKPGYTFQTLQHTYKLQDFDMSKIELLKNQDCMNCGLKKLYLPSCTEILGSKFNRSYNLQEIYLPMCEGDIPANFASECPNLKKVEMPKIESIGNYAFNSCYSLEEVYAPNCTAIGNYAFNGCYNLQKITVAEGCTFGTNCFQNCYSLYPRPDGSVN